MGLGIRKTVKLDLSPIKESTGDDAGEQIRQARIALRLTQRALSDLSGVTVAAIGQAERGVRTPSLQTLRALSETLGKPVWHLGRFERLPERTLPDSSQREDERMQPYWIYPIYTACIGLVTLALVPRHHIRKISFYAIVLGGVADVVAILLVTHLLGAGGYRNFDPFGLDGMPFFPPLAWTVWFVLFFYFLPRQRVTKYVYIVVAAAYSVIFSNVLIHLGIFEWNYGNVVVPFFIYVSWFLLVTWAKGRMGEAEFDHDTE